MKTGTKGILSSILLESMWGFFTRNWVPQYTNIWMINTPVNINITLNKSLILLSPYFFQKIISQTWCATNIVMY